MARNMDVDPVVGIGSAIASLLPTHRQCTVMIRNWSSHTLINPRMYVSSGSCTRSLPHEITSSKEYMVEFKKTPHTACGAVGVFTYELHYPRSKLCTKKLAYMFSVPYDYNLYHNWHAGGFFGKNKSCDDNLFNEMCKGAQEGFLRQKGGIPFSHSDGRFKVEATMTDTHTPVMTVEIYND